MANPLPPPVSALERRLGLDVGSLVGTERARAEEALVDAAVLVLAEVPAAKATAWTADAPAVAVLVTLKAARREFENPRGMSNEALGEHSVGLTDTSGVYLTGREVAQVRRAATGRTRGFVGTLRTPSEYSEDLVTTEPSITTGAV